MLNTLWPCIRRVVEKNTEQCLLNMCVVCFMLSWQSIDSFVRRLRVKVIHQACRPPYAYNKQQQSRNRLFLWSGRTYFSSFVNSISLIVKSLHQVCRLPYAYNIRNNNLLRANIAKVKKVARKPVWSSATLLLYVFEKKKNNNTIRHPPKKFDIVML